VRHSLLAIICLLTVAACGSDTEPSETGSLELTFGAADNLDSGRVHLEGPTPKTVEVIPGSRVTLTELAPGTYTISLEGFVGGAVDQFGRVAGVEVKSGATTTPTVRLESFRPVLGPIGLNADGTELTIAFTALAGAVDYHLKIDNRADFSTASEQTLSGTNAQVPLDAQPAKFIVVRATDPFGVPGRFSDTLEAQILMITSDPSLDGGVRSDGFFDANGQDQPLVGDVDAAFPGSGVRQFFSFDLTSGPILTTVDAAVVRLYQFDVVGQPYAVLGDVLLDHLDYMSNGGLDGSDYSATPDEDGLGPISIDVTLAVKTLDVTAQVRGDLSLSRTRSQYRARFSVRDSNNDGVNDFVKFADGEDDAGTGLPAQLVIVSHL
jgi:hypothetical protein